MKTSNYNLGHLNMYFQQSYYLLINTLLINTLLIYTPYFLTLYNINIYICWSNHNHNHNHSHSHHHNHNIFFIQFWRCVMHTLTDVRWYQTLRQAAGLLEQHRGLAAAPASANARTFFSMQLMALRRTGLPKDSEGPKRSLKTTYLLAKNRSK